MQAINQRDTVSTAIRARRTEQVIQAGSGSFRARQAQVEAIAAAILADGLPELESDSSALCTHYRLRKGQVEGDYTEAQVTRHAAGYVIRFWVYPSDFSVRVRDLILLPPSDGGKGWEMWLDTRSDGAEGRLFPHEGKYVIPGLLIMGHHLSGR